MMNGARLVELTERKRQILKVVIEDYIRTAEPVGSKAIAAEMGGSVSSATIRNELSDLTEQGYLEQPHTSAGRMPSPKGYRLYVNELMEETPQESPSRPSIRFTALVIPTIQITVTGTESHPKCQ